MTHAIRTLLIAQIVGLLMISHAQAVRPSAWQHRTEADFAQGENQDTLVTNLGDVRLARATTLKAELPSELGAVHAIAPLAEGAIAIAAGPEGRLMRLSANSQKPDVIHTYAGAQVFALAPASEGLWVAVSGSPSRLERLAGPDLAVAQTIELPDVRYIWDILVDGDTLWLAVGTPGRVLSISTHAAAAPVEVLKAKQNNVLCLGIDQSRRIYAGTDTDGLVYRLTPRGNSYETFVLYDADEPEIGALWVDPDGTVFAGTADAKQAKPGRLTQAQKEPAGRPAPPAADQKEPTLPNVPPKPEPKQQAPQNPARAKTPAASAPVQEPAAPKIEASAPTPEQYQQLRETVAQRLAQARDAGRLELVAGDGGARPAPVRRSTATSARSGTSGGKPSGNAVYRINRDGFVHAIFRESVMVLRIVRSGASLLIATGNEGQIYRVDPDAGEVSTLVALEPQQVAALLDLGNGQILAGTANPARVIQIEANAFARSGTLTGPALDASQISLWGKLHVEATMPEGTSLRVQTRSGNVSDPESDTWSDWSRPREIGADATGVASAHIEIPSPTARFMQYRLNMGSDGRNTPAVIGVGVLYLMPNLQPTVDAIKAEPVQAKPAGAKNDEPQPMTMVKITWQSSDPNKDRLNHKLEARLFGRDNAPFVTIAEDLDKNELIWDTRTIPDGRYVLRLTASDELDNIPDQALERSRLSDPLIVDNTPPDFPSLAIEINGRDARLVAEARDALSPLAEVRYRLDSEDRWHLVLPQDLIYDSTTESIVVRLPGLSPGGHSVTLRATDTLGNSRYAAKTFQVAP